MKSILLFFVPLFIFSALAQAKVDSSSQIFLPQKEGKAFQIHQQAPITWWNFFFYNSKVLSKEAACLKINSLQQSNILFHPCREIPLSAQWLNSWGKEETLSNPPPATYEELKKSLDSTLVQLSLPIASGPLGLIKENPLAHFEKISSQLFNFYQSNDTQLDWQVIPVLFNFPSSDQRRNKELFEQSPQLITPTQDYFWAGPHIGAHVNKTQIISDLKRVMALGFVLILALLLFLWFSGKKIFLLVLPVLATSIGLSFLVVNILWGSIHGLTLAFGCGLIGISMDYAFHGWRNKHNKKVWRSNGISYLTTLFVFLLLSFFSTPLIQQISIFASFGLSFSFLFCYLISRHFSHFIRVEKIEFNVPRFTKKTSFLVAGLLIGLGGFGLLTADTDFSLSRMDYAESTRPQDINSDTFFQKKAEFAFLVTPANQLDLLDSTLSWSQQQKIPFLGVPIFRGLSSLFDKNLQQWKNLVCGDNNFLKQLQSQKTYTILFKNFFKSLECEELKKITPKTASASINLFSSKTHILSILKIDSPEKKEIILERFPNTFFLSSLTVDFPKKLQAEVTRFFILIILLSLIILTFFFKKVVPRTLLPVLGGAGGISIAMMIFDKPLSFISFISMIMLLGLTLDYGIFCTSYIQWKKPLNRAFGSIALSAATSVAGFTPLVLCSHPVLQDMGITITSGLLGACLVTFLVYPHLNSPGEKTL